MSSLDAGPSDATKFDPGQPDITAVPDWFQRYLYAALGSPLFTVPKPFETWMIDKVATSGFDLPIGQIVGFTQFTAQTAFVLASQSTSSTSYTDLTTAGPSLTGIPDGVYLMLFGAQMSTNDSTSNTRMAISVNSATPSDDDSLSTTSTNPVPGFRGVLVTLNGGGNNSLEAKYKAERATASATFLRRQLFALRVGSA